MYDGIERTHELIKESKELSNEIEELEKDPNMDFNVYRKEEALKYLRFLYKGIIIKHNKTEPTYTKTSLFLCEKRRFFMARTEKGVVATI